MSLQAFAQTDPLVSWNDGPTKQAIVRFVRTTTDQASPKFVPPAERIATSTRMAHSGRAPSVHAGGLLPRPGAGGHQGEAGAGEDRAVQDRVVGDREAITKLSMDDILKIVAATLTGMSVDKSQSRDAEMARHRQGSALEPTYTELTYLPMIELLKYLRANGYRTYIVTGGGQDFVRVYSEEIYGIPPSR